jgi:septin family protein
MWFHKRKQPFKVIWKANIVEFLDYIYEQIAKYLTADNSVVHNSNANDMRVTQDLNSFGEIE